MTIVRGGHELSVGLRELSQRTARIIALVREGNTVEVTDRGKPVARIVPATDSRYEQLLAAGAIRPGRRAFDATRLPTPAPNPTERTTTEWLEDLRGER
jgi:prevent-host-death family protein